jgi:hypothetical protein
VATPQVLLVPSADLDVLFEKDSFLAQECRFSPDDPIVGHLAWAAGFWDGEGHVGARGNGRSGGRQIKAMITQKDRRVLEHFQEITGLGKIYPRRVQDQWSWNLARVIKVRELARLLWPWLGEIKRDQFIYAFGAYELLRPLGKKGRGPQRKERG